jgi:hypothetical protein
LNVETAGEAGSFALTFPRSGLRRAFDATFVTPERGVVAFRGLFPFDLLTAPAFLTLPTSTPSLWLEDAL